jgi:glycosyltransferase involved in cell wall biosynthesis
LPKSILITGLSLPGCGASEIHAFRIARALSLVGLKTIVLVEKRQGRPQDLLGNGKYRYEGIEYVPVGECSIQWRLLRRITSFLGIRNPSLQWMAQLPERPLAVIALHPLSALFIRLRKWCRENDVAFIPEQLEWHSRAEMHGLIYWLDMEFRIRILQRMHGIVMVLTKFLEDYYVRRGCRVFHLPPILDTQDAVWRPREGKDRGSTIKLVFSGSPPRDRHDLIFGGMLLAKKEGLQIVIEYVGSTREQLEALLPRPALLDELGDSVKFHGRVPSENVPDILAQADYTVLMRDDARWSKACFPSKVPEFLALGIPVICNLTSDLGAYLQDGREAFLVKELSERAFLEALRRAVAARGEARNKMGIWARKKAEGSFDVRCFSKSLGEFIVKSKA